MSGRVSDEQLAADLKTYEALGKLVPPGSNARLPAYLRELQEAREALRELADEAARACTEPRRFHENEDDRQQALSQAVARARSVGRGAA